MLPKTIAMLFILLACQCDAVKSNVEKAPFMRREEGAPAVEISGAGQVSKANETAITLGGSLVAMAAVEGKFWEFKCKQMDGCELPDVLSCPTKRTNSVPPNERICPCEPVPCDKTWTCIKAAKEVANSDAQDACSKVEKLTANAVEKACCWQLLAHCKTWQDDCFTKIYQDNNYFDFKPRKLIEVGQDSAEMAQRSKHNASENEDSLDESLTLKTCVGAEKKK